MKLTSALSLLRRMLPALGGRAKHVVAACQMTSTDDKEQNFETCKRLIQQAKVLQAKMIFLPECFDFVPKAPAQSVALASAETDEYIERYRQLARDLKVWLSLGGFHEKSDTDPSRCHNTHLLLDDDGQTVTKYRKLHLFDLEIKDVVRVKETNTTIPADIIQSPVSTPAGKLGLATCYDVRFAEHSLLLRKAGAEILTYPSAFTLTTGMAHWEVLLRARAIENQCFVIAAAQTGSHNEKRISYGHAMIVDPWGAVLAQCGEGTGLCTAAIDLNYLDVVRQQLPCQDHRRPDVYALTSPSFHEEPDSHSQYTFGEHKIPSQHVFYKSMYSYAFVNRKPFVPGHLLVSSLRPVPKLSDLNPTEAADLFGVVQIVQRVNENLFNVRSSTIAVQDGPEAGQTVRHVHVHVMPRSGNDFDGDEFYRQFALHDKVNVINIRDSEDMANEAAKYRQLFRQPGTYQ